VRRKVIDGKAAEALTLCEGNSSAASAVVASGLRYAGRTRDPKAFVLSVLTVADLASAAQRFEAAFSTLVDGAELARRVFGDRAARPLDDRYTALAARLGPERVAALHGWRRRRTEMLLRRARR